MQKSFITSGPDQLASDYTVFKIWCKFFDKNLCVPFAYYGAYGNSL